MIEQAKPGIAVVVLNYNSSTDCHKCIGDLKRQTGVGIEIVVVDNCSRPEERKAVEMLCRETGCTFIANDTNRGYNAGNNVGLRYAASKGYEYAAIANPDMEFPQTDYFTKLMTCIQADENIAACGSDIITPEGTHQNPRYYPPTKWYHCFRWLGECRKRKKQSEIPDWVDTPLHPHYCDGLNGCCFILQMNFLLRIGFLDEGLFLYGEEPILSSQIKRVGMKLYYDSNAIAIHNHRESSKPPTRFQIRHWRHSQLYTLRKYNDYPFYGLWFAYFSILLKFTVLDIYHMFKGIISTQKNKNE